jgi:predicted DNA-binding antitoxin AbrB/MazE fold protein
MSTTVDAIYEDGKLLLQHPLPLANKTRLRVTVDTENNPAVSEAEREAWSKLSQQSLMKVWDNPDDDVFNDLLKK